MEIVSSEIDKYLNSLRGKNIKITYNEFNSTGFLQSVKSKQYYYELVVKSGRYKKKITLFFPFSAKMEKGIIFFDYRIKKLPLYIQSELVYNLLEGDCHPYLNKIVQICELI